MIRMTTIDPSQRPQKTRRTMMAGRCHLHFRSLVGYSLLWGISVSLLERAVEGGEAPATSLTIVQQTRGELYELGGKRWVFTTWFYIRPGSFAWLNDKGQSVAVVGSAGPPDCGWRSPPGTGCRFQAEPSPTPTRSSAINSASRLLGMAKIR